MKNKKWFWRGLTVSIVVGFLLSLVDGIGVLSEAFVGQSMIGWLLISYFGAVLFLVLGAGAGMIMYFLKIKKGNVEAVMAGLWVGLYFFLKMIDAQALVYTEGWWVKDLVRNLQAFGWMSLSVCLGWLVGKGLSKWQIGDKSLKRIGAVWLLASLVAVGLIVWAPGVRGVRTRDVGGEGKSLILITVDTLRGDVVDKGLMSETVSFFKEDWVRKVYAPSSWTAPSFASMFTGKVSTEIGADENMEQVVEKGVERIFVPKQVETLAERLESEGYVAQAIVNNFLLNKERGYEQGFEGFYNREDVRRWHWVGANQKVSVVKLWHRIPWLGEKVRGLYGRVVGVSFQPWSEDGADQIVEQGIEWLEGRESKKGVFLWLHLVDPHSPYKYHKDYGVESEVEPRELGSLEHIEEEDKMRLREVDRQAVRELYEGEVRFTDKGLGRFWRYLEESGWEEKSVVIFTSDHGEEFWEHGNLGHVRSFYDEVVKVPLMIRGAEQEKVEGELSLVDLKGSVLEMLGVESDERSWFDESYSDGTIWLDADGLGPIRKGMREGKWKYIEDIDGNRELYDLRIDKGEEDNLVKQYPGLVERLSKKLRDFYEKKEERGIRSEDEFESGVFVGY